MELYELLTKAKHAVNCGTGSAGHVGAVLAACYNDISYSSLPVLTAYSRKGVLWIESSRDPSSLAERKSWEELVTKLSEAWATVTCDIEHHATIETPSGCQINN